MGLLAEHHPQQRWRRHALSAVVKQVWRQHAHLLETGPCDIEQGSHLSLALLVVGKHHLGPRLVAAWL